MAIYYTKFGVNAIIYFGIMLITGMLKTTAKKYDFLIQGISKRVNSSKFPLQKFDPKTILYLPIGTKK